MPFCESLASVLKRLRVASLQTIERDKVGIKTKRGGGVDCAYMEMVRMP